MEQAKKKTRRNKKVNSHLNCNWLSANVLTLVLTFFAFISLTFSRNSRKTKRTNWNEWNERKRNGNQTALEWIVNCFIINLLSAKWTNKSTKRSEHRTKKKKRSKTATQKQRKIYKIKIDKDSSNNDKSLNCTKQSERENKKDKTPIMTFRKITSAKSIIRRRWKVHSRFRLKNTLKENSK